MASRSPLLRAIPSTARPPTAARDPTRRRRAPQQSGYRYSRGIARRYPGETGCYPRGVDREHDEQCLSTLRQTFDLVVVDEEVGREGDGRLICGRSGTKLRVERAHIPNHKPSAERLTGFDFGRPIHPLHRHRIDFGAGLACSEETETRGRKHCRAHRPPLEDPPVYLPYDPASASPSSHLRATARIVPGAFPSARLFARMNASTRRRCASLTSRTKS